MGYYIHVILILDWTLAHFIEKSNRNGLNNKQEYATLEKIVVRDFERTTALV